MIHSVIAREVTLLRFNYFNQKTPKQSQIIEVEDCFTIVRHDSINSYKKRKNQPLCLQFYTLKDGDFSFSQMKEMNPYIFIFKKEQKNVNTG